MHSNNVFNQFDHKLFAAIYSFLGISLGKHAQLLFINYLVKFLKDYHF